MSLDRGTQIGGGIGHFDYVAAEPHPTALSIDARLDLHRFTSKKNLRSDQPFLWPGWARAEPMQFPLKPFLVSFREPLSLRDRAAARNRHPSRTVRAQPEQITACARVADQNHRNLALAQCQKLFALRSSGRIQDELKLHALSKRMVTGLGKPDLISSIPCGIQQSQSIAIAVWVFVPGHSRAIGERPTPRRAGSCPHL